MKKACLIICALSLLTALTGLPYLISGISARGFSGVNYGRIVFPLLICALSFWRYRKESSNG